MEKKIIPINPKDLISLLVRKSLIESAQKRLGTCQEELQLLKADNTKYWEGFSAKYGLNKEDKYQIDQDNCLLLIIKGG